MRCKYCNVEVDDNAKVCPLCHEKLDGYDPDAPSLYPEKHLKKEKKSRFTFNNLYWGIAIPVFLICIIINFLVTPELQWCWLVGLLGLYGFLFVANTIKSNSSVTLKVVAQTLMIFILVATAIWVFSASRLYDNPEYYVINYALPSILGLGSLVLIIFTGIYIKKKPSILVDLIFILLIGYIPMIMYWSNYITVLWPSITTLLVSAIGHLLCIFFWRGEVKEEVKKKFHM